MKLRIALLLCAWAAGLHAQEDALKQLDARAGAYGDIALQIWDWAEMGRAITVRS